MWRVCRMAALVVLVSALGAAGARAASLESVGSFETPIYVTSDPGNPNRLFVAEREGFVRVDEGGSDSTWADLSNLVECCESERGLLSIALAPDFDSSGRIYVTYTGTAAAGSSVGDVHLDAFTHAEGKLVRERVLTVSHSSQANHNGGQLQFGPDGYLYVSLGDGGGGGDPFESGQNTETLLGKLLRIEPRPGESPPYVSPAGNPFLGGAGRDEIWAYGLRNPWRFSFDRASGDLVIGDVGQGEWEEIDRVPSPGAGQVGGAGDNFGWNCREGPVAYSDPAQACEEGAGPFVEPVFYYSHSGGSPHPCSITGGYVVRDPSLGELDGRYLYGDYCVGQLRSIDLSAPDPAATDRAETGLSVPTFSLYSFGEDSCGRVYVVNGGGEVSRVVGEEPPECAEPEEEGEEEPEEEGEEEEPEEEPEPEEEGEPEPEEEGEPEMRGPVMPRILVPPAMDESQGRLSARVRVSAAPRRVRRGRRVRIVVRVKPCAANRGRRVVLKQGGKRRAAKLLGHDCVVRFRLRVMHRASFRALLPLPTRDARSPRLVVRTFAVGRT